jgi:NAD(P)-dependent dehydrogenase (short-subunit alcohol dehydrogenase family)
MTQSGHPRTALIIGASRGLGLGLVQRHLERGWSVIATVRSRSEALAALEGALRIETLDMTEPAQIADLGERLSSVALDLLFVNAGIIDDPTMTAGAVTDAVFHRVMATNALAPLRVIEQFGRLVMPGGTIAVMSSGLGSVANNGSGGYETYRASKAALNSLLKSASSRDRTDTRTWLAVDPGWVRTDMGGDAATLDVETSTRGIVDMLEANRGRGGVGFLNHRGGEVAW